jgi:hypothetical protein
MEQNNTVEKAGILRVGLATIGKFINYKMGALGATIMGGIVWHINADHGFWPATYAAMKQFTYTLFLGGTLIRLLETIVMKIKKPVLALLVAVTFTSLLTISLVFIVHNLRGTPKPFESTIPTILTAPFGFFILAYRKRKLEDAL